LLIPPIIGSLYETVFAIGIAPKDRQAMITRRTLLLGAGAAMLAKGATAQVSGSASTSLSLWPAKPPGGGGPAGPTQVSKTGAVSQIAMPALEVIQPDRPNGAAMLVAAGGGYKRIQMGKEAQPAARWLADRGITAFMLSYRLPGEGWNAGALAPLQDAQRALRVIRSRAAQDHLDPVRIGVLGFSAGGHLMGLAATRSSFRSYDPVDELDTLSARPAVAALIYPVITLQPPYDRTSARRVLIGRHPDPAASAEWSVETHVRAGNPPVFLVQAADDPISNPENTVIMARTCEQAGVPVECHRLPSGGHGFGMGQPGSPTADWPGWYEAWLRRSGMIA
jgi:acetyl esterase/lipase